MLVIQEFIKENNYQLDQLFVDKFWNNIRDDKKILIDDQIIRWLTGNQNAKIGKSRGNIKNKIIKCELTFEEINYNDLPKYLGRSNNKNKNNNNIFKNFEIKEERILKITKFILIVPDDFKMLCMMCNTEKGKQIRRYYITLEKIFKDYLRYQMQYKEKLLSIKDEKIDNLTKSMELLREENAKNLKKLLDVGKRIWKDNRETNVKLIKTNEKLEETNNNYKKTKNKLIETNEKLEETNNNYKKTKNKLIETNDKLDETNNKLDEAHDKLDIIIDYLPFIGKTQYAVIYKIENENSIFKYYIVRAQGSGVKRSYNKLKKKHKDIFELVRFVNEPNPIKFKFALFKYLKKNFTNKFVKKSNYFNLFDVSDDNFKKLLVQFNIDERKKIIE